MILIFTILTCGTICGAIYTEKIGERAYQTQQIKMSQLEENAEAIKESHPQLYGKVKNTARVNLWLAHVVFSTTTKALYNLAFFCALLAITQFIILRLLKEKYQVKGQNNVE